MAYIAGLLIVLALIFTATTKTDLLSGSENILQNLKTKLMGQIFPKTEKEILIEGLGNNYKTLEDFFSEVAPDILKSKDISSEDKKALQNALNAVTDSGIKLTDLKKQNDGVLENIIDRILPSETTPPAGSPEPTYIPPQCKLVCPNQ